MTPGAPEELLLELDAPPAPELLVDDVELLVDDVELLVDDVELLVELPPAPLVELLVDVPEELLLDEPWPPAPPPTLESP